MRVEIRLLGGFAVPPQVVAAELVAECQRPSCALARATNCHYSDARAAGLSTPPASARQR